MVDLLLPEVDVALEEEVGIAEGLPAGMEGSTRTLGDLVEGGEIVKDCKIDEGKQLHTLYSG